MTPADLRAWQKISGHTYESAAAALGMSRSGYAKLLASSGEVDRRTALAISALEAGLQPWVPPATSSSPAPRPQ